MICPNISSPAWKKLVDKVGENLAWKEFLIYGEIPDADDYQVSPVVIRPGVQELFDSNSELASIGQPEQYSAYLDSIFPDSNVKDIVYHGTLDKIDSFDKSKIGKNTIQNRPKGFYFTRKNVAENLYGVYKTQSQENGEEEFIKGNTIAALIDSSKNYQLVEERDDISGYGDFVEYKSHVVFEPEQIHILGNKQDIEGFKKFTENSTTPNVFRSLRTKSTEQIAAGINKDLIRNQNDLKYTSYIMASVINTLGDISPNQKLSVKPADAFRTVKGIYAKTADNLKMALNGIITSEQDLQEVKDSKDYQTILKTFPTIAYVNSYEDMINAAETYDKIVNNFDFYQDYVIAELARKGIRMRIDKDSIENVSVDDVTIQETDDLEDTEISQNEIGERYDRSIFETNPRDTASVRVKAFVQTIKTGKFEMGIPIYADPNDVFADLLVAGSEMAISGYTDAQSKLQIFTAALEKRLAARPYLDDVLTKVNNYKKENNWSKINDILTFSTKAFAQETLMLYKTRKDGNQVTGITDVKVINSNRDTVEDQVSRDWLESHKQSGFFSRSSTGELKPKAEKLSRLAVILEESKIAGANKVNKFKEFFSVLGIDFTDKDLEYITPRIAKKLDRKEFENLFIQNNLLNNIYTSFLNNKDQVFDDNYGFQDEKGSMRKLATLYYEANPGKYNIASARTADGKQKYLYILTNFIEKRKRQWGVGQTASVTNSALARPNKSFWNNVKNGVNTFILQYFNGIREQEAGKDGKVRKSLTDKEQTVTMFLKHQENLKTATYINFTLSDKTTTIETKMTKEFFVDSENNLLGKAMDYSVNETGEIIYNPALIKKLYNTFAEPEISRILSAIKYGKDVNLENYDIASKLFYFIPSLNSDVNLEEFRNDLYSGKNTIEQLKAKYEQIVGKSILDIMKESTEVQIDQYLANGIIKRDKESYTFPTSINGYKNTDYINRLRSTGLKGRNAARLMVIDLKMNYMNSQVKMIQFLRFDPALAFKPFKEFNKASKFSEISGQDKVKLTSATWDEFSKRAAALIAPGAQGSYTWDYKDAKTGEKKTYLSSSYNAITAADVEFDVNNTKNVITDAQEFVTVQEHIDSLMSEGKIPDAIWLSIYNKINEAGPGGFYKLSKEEMGYTLTPTKPVQVNDMNEASEESGLNRVDYVKSSRYPLIPQHEVGSERDKLRQWMERNDIRAVNFASGKKLGRPATSVKLFSDDGKVFIEPETDQWNKALQTLSRDGLRTQQEIPNQKDEIRTVSQMNRTLFDNMLKETFSLKGIQKLEGTQAKTLKEQVRAKLFNIEAEKLQKELGNLNKSHRGLHRLLKNLILNDTTGSYGENDLRNIEINPETGKFKHSLELQFKAEKYQGLINSLINKNVMLKVDGSSFIQVSAVGAKYSFSALSKGIKNDITWTDTYAKTFEKDDEASLKYIRKENGQVKAAQVIVSQYFRNDKGELIDLSDYIVEKKIGNTTVKILDTSKFSPEMFELVGTRIPNQSHPSMLPIEVVGFLPAYMENTIIVPDGITGQMGSDFDVDKLYAYMSKMIQQDGKYVSVQYELDKLEDIESLNENQLKQLYRDIHWMALTHPAAYNKITKSIDMSEVKDKVAEREETLAKYGIPISNSNMLPLDFGTSINRFNDNRSGKVGVGVYANLISAQADFQDKILRLGSVQKDVEVPNPIKIRMSKKDKTTIDLLFLGQPGTVEYEIKDKKSNKITVERSVSDNLNMMFTESVDNAKNLFLREFNWDDKAMSAIGVFQMLTDSNGTTAPIQFSMDLTSQASIKYLFTLIDQKRDSFGEYDANALESSMIEIQKKLAERMVKQGNFDTIDIAKKYLEDDTRDQVLDAETLNEMWLVGKANELPEEQKQAALVKIAKDLNYSSVKSMLLKYDTVQYDSLNLFKRMEDIGREMQTILGGVYVYTKGIGPNVFATKQKTNQLNKLSESSNFIGISNIAGKISKNKDTGKIEIEPLGEIGAAIENSLMVAQRMYDALFPISSGKTIETIVDILLENQGKNKEQLGREAYVKLYKSIFNGIKAYMYTMPGLELFQNPTQTRNELINGNSSIGKRILDLTKEPKLKANGFLKNVEVKQAPKQNAFTISFKAPFGSDLDEKAILSGFYELAVSDIEEVRQLAKDLAIYPYVTGDAGNIGRFIPVDYLMSDEDFSKMISELESVYSSNMGESGAMSTLMTQIVQNNPEEFAKSYKYSTYADSRGANDNPFKRILKKFISNADDLSKVDTFSITVGDFKNDPKGNNLAKSLEIPLSNKEVDILKSRGIDPSSIKFKYPPFIQITDTYTNEQYNAVTRNINYLYKRVSEIEESLAKYERINILGYNGIKEYDFNNPELLSAIEGNNNVENDAVFQENVIPAISVEPGAINPTDYTNHSGGAALSDTEWDQIGREFGVTNHRHYREPGATELDSVKLKTAGVKPVNISEADYNEGVQKATQAMRTMFKDSSNKTARSAYIIRNWAQVKYADAVYALGTIKQPGEKASDKKDDNRIAAVPLVKGGTGYAVQMAIIENKPVYVFDATKDGWYKYDYDVKNFVLTEIPVLTKNFAGIGSRTLSTEKVVEQSMQAIRDVYTKTFAQAEPAVTTTSKVEISSNLLNQRVETLLQKGITILKQDGTYDVQDVEDGIIGEYMTTLEEAVILGEQYNRDNQESNVLEQILTDEEPNREQTKLEYGKAEFIAERDAIGYDYYYAKGDGSLGAKVEGPLLRKVHLVHAVQLYPERVVSIQIGSKKNSYYVIDDRIYSLQSSSFGDLITSEDVTKRVFQQMNTKLEDKIEVSDSQEDDNSKPTFTYKNVTVSTEFKLSSEQSEALQNIIDFVESRTSEEGTYDGTYTLEGYAGTGKTSIIGVLDRYMNKKARGTKFLYMAPTHAATVALAINIVKYGATELPMTIQASVTESRDPRRPGPKFTKTFNDRATAIKNVIVLDEASMLANKDFEKLILAAKAEGYKIIFMGDPKQIPEVTPGAKTKELAKAFANPNKSMLTSVFRTKDNNILSVLTNIRNNSDFIEYEFESTDNMKQLNRTEYNEELISDLQNNLEDVVIINYTNDGVSKINKAARQVLGYTGALKSGEKIVGYLGSQTKQIEKGHLANSVSYMVKDISVRDEGDVVITATSKLLDELQKAGMKGFPPEISFRYLQMSPNDSFDFGLTNQQMENNKQQLKTKLKNIHELNELYQRKGISYPSYLVQVQAIRMGLAEINTGAFYIYNPSSDSIELFDKEKHRTINANLQMDKGVDFGYGITIHKSQGMTIPIVYFDTNSLSAVKDTPITRDGNKFNTEKNALYYVGMSRASNKLVVPKNNVVPSIEEDFGFDMAMLAELEAPMPEIVVNPIKLFQESQKDDAIDVFVKELFGTEETVTDYKGFLNKLYSKTSELNKAIISAVSKTGELSPVTFKIDKSQKDMGLYNSATKTITINPTVAIADATDIDDMKSKIHEVIMHELVHHVTVDLLSADSEKLKPEQRKWVKGIKNLFDQVQLKMIRDPQHSSSLMLALSAVSSEGYLSANDKSLYYGLTSVYDFATMLITDKGFQQFMNNVEFTGDKSILDRFMELVISLIKSLGIEVKDNSVLNEGLKNIIGLLGSRDNSNENLQRSIATENINKEYIENNFATILNVLNIKTNC